MPRQTIVCCRQGDVFVVDLGSEAQPAVFYLTQEETAAFAESLEAEITYRLLQVEVFGKTNGDDAPMIIADVAFTQQDARRLLVALQVMLDKEEQPKRRASTWQREGF